MKTGRGPKKRGWPKYTINKRSCEQTAKKGGNFSTLGGEGGEGKCPVPAKTPDEEAGTSSETIFAMLKSNGPSKHEMPFRKKKPFMHRRGRKREKTFPFIFKGKG